MNPEEHHVALPKLYGAPAYARPPRVFDADDRPLDPDDLPLEAFRADDRADMTLATGDPSASSTTAADAWGTVAPVSAARPAFEAAEPHSAEMHEAELRATGTAEAASATAGDPTSPARASAGDQGAPPVLQPRPLSVRALRRFLGGR